MRVEREREEGVQGKSPRRDFGGSGTVKDSQ